MASQNILELLKKLESENNTLTAGQFSEESLRALTDVLKRSEFSLESPNEEAGQVSNKFFDDGRFLGTPLEISVLPAFLPKKDLRQIITLLTKLLAKSANRQPFELTHENQNRFVGEFEDLVNQLYSDAAEESTTAASKSPVGAPTDPEPEADAPEPTQPTIVPEENTPQPPAKAEKTFSYSDVLRQAVAAEGALFSMWGISLSSEQLQQLHQEFPQLRELIIQQVMTTSEGFDFSRYLDENNMLSPAYRTALLREVVGGLQRNPAYVLVSNELADLLAKSNTISKEDISKLQNIRKKYATNSLRTAGDEVVSELDLTKTNLQIKKEKFKHEIDAVIGLEMIKGDVDGFINQIYQGTGTLDAMEAFALINANPALLGNFSTFYAKLGASEKSQLFALLRKGYNGEISALQAKGLADKKADSLKQLFSATGIEKLRQEQILQSLNAYALAGGSSTQSQEYLRLLQQIDVSLQLMQQLQAEYAQYLDLKKMSLALSADNASLQLTAPDLGTPEFDQRYEAFLDPLREFDAEGLAAGVYGPQSPDFYDPMMSYSQDGRGVQQLKGSKGNPIRAYQSLRKTKQRLRVVQAAARGSVANAGIGAGLIGGGLATIGYIASIAGPVVGGLAGAGIGAAIGGFIGTFVFPVIGTALGAVIGGALGGGTGVVVGAAFTQSSSSGLGSAANAATADAVGATKEILGPATSQATETASQFGKAAVDFAGGAGESEAAASGGTMLASAGAVGGGIAGITIISLFSITYIMWTFLPDANVEFVGYSEGEFSQYVEMKKTATPSSIENNTPTEIQYTITISPKEGYSITPTAIIDEFSYLGGQALRLPNQTPTISQQLGLNQAIAAGQSKTINYTVPITGVDVLVNNTVKLTFSVSFNGETVEGETFKASTSVTIGNPDMGCFVFGDAGYSFPGGSVSSVSWPEEYKNQFMTSFLRKIGSNASFLNLLCKDSSINVYYLGDKAKWGGWAPSALGGRIIGLYLPAFRNQSTTEYTITHEFMHLIDYKNPGLRTAFSASKRTSSCFTYPVYLGVTCNEYEAFAEGGMLYAHYKNYRTRYAGSDGFPNGYDFKSLHPVEYEWFKNNVYGGIEY